ncbi:MAG: alpha-amylase family glycosyl hydrolase [Syntrophobacteraceae bacterium]
MRPWPVHPVIYEINTWVWLRELSRTYKRLITLATVPEQEWDAVASFGFDAVWFMGVWERSPAGIEISMRNQGLIEDFCRALPDFSASDNIGSPYCVRRYIVDESLGGPSGLAIAREKLAERGMRLILDFVPNHVAPDHPWAAAHPEYFIRGDDEDLRRNPASFLAVGGKVLACGRDPYFPAWPDVLQLNAFDPGLRSAVAETMQQIADQCDGVRCDMAMLMMNDIFERTWGQRAGARPAEDYWPALIPDVRSGRPDFRFIAEAYWGLEWALQQQGFDFCYDKRLYDRMEHGDAENVRLHLLADLWHQHGLVRFLENHDEPRAAATFPDKKARAAAVAVLTLPGAKLLHEGQFEGRRVRVPVFLGRRPEEQPDRDLEAFYRELLTETNREIFRNGQWRLCERTGWPDNASCWNVLAWCWELGAERHLIALNFSDAPSQAMVHLPWADLRGRTWRLSDSMAGEAFERSGDDMADHGLFVSLDPWLWHSFRMEAGS